ncbi:MAG: hypothetical protein N2170_04095 [Bacteroidia bacterium]|nr:hypothetical protein [Bacteroidia bacterium]
MLNRVAFLFILMGLSPVGFAQVQNGESMATAYDITNALFSTPQISGGFRTWSWYTFDSTRSRANNHALNSGPDVVWKVVLPECLDSLDVHFAYHDDGEDGVFPTNHRLYLINASSADTVLLLENSYDDYMNLWVTFRSGWVGLISGYVFNGPGTAYLRGRESSRLFSSGTGAGWGSPLDEDTLRLAAGDTLYFIYTHNNAIPSSVDTLYLEIKAIQRLRPSLRPLNLQVSATPSQACMGSSIAIEYVSADTLNDGRVPSLYRFESFSYQDGQMIGSSILTSSSPSGSYVGSIAYTTPTALTQGYSNYQEKWIVRGIYPHPFYPNHPYRPNSPACWDTSQVSDTLLLTTRLTLVPDPKIRYNGVDYSHGQSLSITPGAATFTAVDAIGINPSLLSYEWRLDGNVVGNSNTLNQNLSAGSHTLVLKITNAPTNAVACDSAITLRLDVSTALSMPDARPTISSQGGIVSVLVPQPGSYLLEAYDIQGQRLYHHVIEGGNAYALGPIRGVVILQIRGEGKSYLQRLFVE